MIIKTDTIQTTNVIMLLSIGCRKLVFLIYRNKGFAQAIRANSLPNIWTLFVLIEK